MSEEQSEKAILPVHDIQQNIWQESLPVEEEADTSTRAPRLGHFVETSFTLPTVHPDKLLFEYCRYLVSMVYNVSGARERIVNAGSWAIRATLKLTKLFLLPDV